MRMSLLCGVKMLVLGGAAAAARGRLPLSPSRLAAVRSGFSSANPTAEGTTHETSPDPRTQTRPASPRVRGLSRPPMCGGIVDAPGREKHPEAIELARFAVAEHNSKTNAALEFVRLVNVRTQLVAGRMYYFTVEVREVDGGVGANKMYEAKVWIRQWENFKGLDAFEPVTNAA